MESPSPEASVLGAERREQVAAALEALEREHRTVIALRHVNGLGMGELAQALTCSRPTARARLRSASHLFALELRRRGLVPGEET